MALVIMGFNFLQGKILFINETLLPIAMGKRSSLMLESWTIKKQLLKNHFQVRVNFLDGFCFVITCGIIKETCFETS
ncbi:MAG: hypothetical protein H7A23_15325 [Leptospiraceae bacterium]|nr:hypothetical protein [Leptospiraceae bacterium]